MNITEMSKINITDMRCWGKKIIDGEWILGFYFAYNGAHFIKNPEDNSNYEIDIETLRRCTGLYDKDSNLIYDGDIVEYGQVLADPLKCYIKYYIVDYKNATCRLRDYHNEESFLFTEAYKVKVMGNILNDKYTSLPIMKGLEDIKNMLYQVQDTIKQEEQTQTKSNLIDDIKIIIESLDKYQLLKG